MDVVPAGTRLSGILALPGTTVACVSGTRAKYANFTTGSDILINFSLFFLGFFLDRRYFSPIFSAFHEPKLTFCGKSFYLMQNDHEAIFNDHSEI